MSIPNVNVNLWGDFVEIFWISQYLQQCINVWNKINGRIIEKIAKQWHPILKWTSIKWHILKHYALIRNQQGNICYDYWNK